VPFDAQYEEKGNGMNWKRTARWSWLILPFLLLALWAGDAAAKSRPAPPPCVKLQAGEACLYEVTEEALFLQGGVPVDPTVTPADTRYATAALLGTTAADSVVCPLPTPCSIVAQGTSVVSLVPDETLGKGQFFGDFSVVVNETGTVDGDEVIILKGKFEGLIDLSPAILYRLGLGGAPVGSLNGLWCQDTGTGCTPNRLLNGTFRLPVGPDGVLKNLLKKRFHVPRRQFVPAFYQLDNGRRVPVGLHERSLLDPTVRLESTFE